MDPLKDVYDIQPGLWHVVIGLLVFGGMARLAFWRDRDGMRIAAPLVVGLALLLTVAILSWARENGRRIQELGPWAAIVLLQAVILLMTNARRKAKVL